MEDLLIDAQEKINDAVLILEDARQLAEDQEQRAAFDEFIEKLGQLEIEVVLLS